MEEHLYKDSISKSQSQNSENNIKRQIEEVQREANCPYGRELN